MTLADQAARILPLAILGMSYDEISQELGMGRSTVNYWIDALTEQGYIVDRGEVISDMFESIENNGKKNRRRAGRASVLTAKGAVYLLKIGAKLQQGTPIAVDD